MAAVPQVVTIRATPTALPYAVTASWKTVSPAMMGIRRIQGMAAVLVAYVTMSVVMALLSLYLRPVMTVMLMPAVPVMTPAQGRVQQPHAGMASIVLS